MKKVLALLNWLRWGAVEEKVMDSIDRWCTTEVAYLDRRGNLIGYWAYGCFDPSFPFRGQEHTIMAKKK